MIERVTTNVNGDSTADSIRPHFTLRFGSQEYGVSVLDAFGFEVGDELGIEPGPTLYAGQLLGDGVGPVDVEFRVRSRKPDAIRCGFKNPSLKTQAEIAALRETVERPRGDALQKLRYDDLARGVTSAVGANGAPQAGAGKGVKSVVALFLLLSMVGVAVFVTLFIRARSSVTVANGVIMGNYVPINTPMAGEVAQVLVSEGDVVNEGDVLVQVVSTDLQAQRDLLQVQLNRARRELRAHQENVEEYEKTIDFVQRKIGGDIQIAEFELQKAEVALTQLDSDLARFTALFKTRSASRADYERTTSLRLAAAAEVDRQKAFIENLKLTQTAAEANILISSERFDQQMSQAVATRKVAAAQVEELEETLDLAERRAQPVELLAPASGTIYAVYRRAGEYLEIADEVLAISDSSDGWAVGHISAYRAPDVRSGQPVECTISAYGISTVGSIAAVGHRGVYGRGGYSADYRGLPTDVPIKIRLPEPLPDVQPGQRLHMTVRLESPFDRIQEWIAALDLSRHLKYFELAVTASSPETYSAPPAGGLAVR